MAWVVGWIVAETNFGEHRQQQQQGNFRLPTSPARRAGRGAASRFQAPIKNPARNGIALRRRFPAADKPGPAGLAGKILARKFDLRRVNFPLVGRSRSLLALSTRRPTRPTRLQFPDPQKPSQPAPDTPRIKMKFCNLFFFLRFFLYMESTSSINHHFLAPRPLTQNLLGVLSKYHSYHQGSLSDPAYLKK